MGAGAAPTYSKEAVGCGTSKKFKRLSWVSQPPARDARHLPLRARPAPSPEWRPIRGSRGPDLPPRAPAPRSSGPTAPPRWLPSPGLDRAPPRSAPGAAGFCAGSPGAGSRFRGSRGRGPRGGGGDRDGGGGGRVEGEEAARRRRRRRRRKRGGEGGGGGERRLRRELGRPRRLLASAARPGPARMRVTSAPSPRPPRDAGPAE